MKFILVGKPDINGDYLDEVAQAAFSVLGQGEGEIELVFISEQKIRSLNNNYRKIDKATDVLSFLIENEPFLGQIFICNTIAKNQAKEHKTSLEAEITKLFVHGILHLYGYDHETDSQEKQMLGKENEIMERINK